MSTIDPRALRNAFGTFITGVTVVTTLDEQDAPLGFTANSFASVSLDPPLLLVCIAKSSLNLTSFAAARGFAVNILSEAQREVSKTFAMPVDDRFASVDWRPGPHGSPLLADVSAWFDCAVHDTVDAGDHLILIGRVEAFENSGANGLGYARGGYFTPGLEERALVAAASDESVVIAAIVERDGHVLLVPEGDERFTIPSTPLASTSASDSDLGRLFDSIGLQASHGFVYAIYQHMQSEKRHIVYRCAASGGDPDVGTYLPLQQIPYQRIEDAATRTMLRRYADESRLGNFGIYFGDERSGTVHPRIAED